MEENDIYVKNGYKNREDYLKNLADEYGVSYSIIETYANILGSSEDFDGLIACLEDNFDFK